MESQMRVTKKNLLTVTRINLKKTQYDKIPLIDNPTVLNCSWKESQSQGIVERHQGSELTKTYLSGKRTE